MRQMEDRLERGLSRMSMFCILIVVLVDRCMYLSKPIKLYALDLCTSLHKIIHQCKHFFEKQLNLNILNIMDCLPVRKWEELTNLCFLLPLLLLLVFVFFFQASQYSYSYLQSQSQCLVLVLCLNRVLYHNSPIS